MTGRTKIEALRDEWYGFCVFSLLVHVVLAFFGSGVFMVLTVPLVLGFGVISFAITWAISALLLRRSSLTRIVLLVLSPIALVLGALSTWNLVTGPWSLGMVLTTLAMVGGVYMQVRSFATLIDRDVRAYFR